MSSIRFVATFTFAAAVTLVLACGGAADRPADSPAAAAPPAAAPSGPAVSITSPAEGATIAADSVEVVMSVAGVKLVPAAAARVDGEGHLHLFIDVPVSRSDIPIPVDPPMVVHIGTGASTYKIPVLPAGPHRIIAVYAYGDHTPDTKVAMDTVNIIIR